MENKKDMALKACELHAALTTRTIQLKDCVNELCYRCGDYSKEHLGACDGCRWKRIRHGDYQE